MSVWGPHSWLWKYDVVSRCIWGCTSLPLFRLKCIQTTSSYWELHYTAQGNTSSLWLHHGSLCGLCLAGFFLSFNYTAERLTGKAPCPSLEDHHDWTAHVLSSANIHPPTHPAAIPLVYCGNSWDNIFHSGYNDSLSSPPPLHHTAIDKKMFPEWLAIIPNRV